MIVEVYPFNVALISYSSIDDNSNEMFLRADTTRVDVTTMTPKADLEDESDLKIFNYESHQVFDFESRFNFDEIEPKVIAVSRGLEQKVESAIDE
jgi:hypothetical protein